ncbi:MAG: T9SS type A sorting domain-containing protein [Saprospiraceae bacterium]|nr:T9SS type A sorting domain-containing protein [Saprospiraceae bacterium]
MKKLILAIQLALFSAQLIAQPQFAPMGAKWYYQYVPCPNGPNEFYFVEEITEDSLIGGKLCTLIKTPNCNINASCSDENYVYQEGDKVYFYEPDFNTFQMIYNFGMQAGDNYRIKVCQSYWDTDSITVVVDSSDVDIEGFQYLRIISDQPSSILNATKYKIKKGVGGLYRNPLLLPDNCVWVSESCDTVKLLCYETPTSGVIHIASNSCIASGIEEIPANRKLIQVFPNPSYDRIVVSLPEPLFINATWSLHDQVGHTLRQVIFSTEKQNEDVTIEGLAAGLYFWQLESEGKLLESGKLIIAK